MDISFVHTETPTTRPVELLAIVDGKLVRITVDSEAMREIVGADRNEADSSHFVRKNRHRLELDIKAYLLAHGVPLDRHLVLTRDDLYRLERTQ